jgi:hypothetical protein
MYFIRRLEIRTLKLLKEPNETDNILLIDDDYNPIKVIFSNYKTAKIYKTQEVIIADEIKDIIKSYLISKDIKINDYVIPLLTNKLLCYCDSNFSKKIKDIFSNVYGANITNRWIRMSFASKNEKLLDSYNQFVDEAKMLSHSNKTHSQYFKVK